jgi:hypothetical protein
MSKRQRAEDKCKRCAAPILWARCNGRPLPLDEEPNTVTGRYVLDEIEMTTFKLEAGMIERALQRGSDLYTNHLATCSSPKKEPK